MLHVTVIYISDLIMITTWQQLWLLMTTTLLRLRLYSRLEQWFYYWLRLLYCCLGFYSTESTTFFSYLRLLFYAYDFIHVYDFYTRTTTLFLTTTYLLLWLYYYDYNFISDYDLTTTKALFSLRLGFYSWLRLRINFEYDYEFILDYDLSKTTNFFLSTTYLQRLTATYL